MHYTQIAENITAFIDEGYFKPGESLPAIRQLASQLDTAVNTMAGAYQEHELTGYIESSGRKGSRVLRGLSADSSRDVKIFKDPVRSLLRKGYDRKQIEQVFRETVKLFFE